MHHYTAGIVARDLIDQRLKQAEQDRMARIATRAAAAKGAGARHQGWRPVLARRWTMLGRAR